jgi:GTP-binding protein
MFVDSAKIYVKGGDGGNGIVSYRREKFVPEGGPAGGDGGRGGDVILVVDEGLRTLLDFRYQRHFKADRGENGKTKNQHGRSAENLYVKVPPGTVVFDADTGEFLGDLVRHGQTLVVARGGRGGRGNARFATPANKAPDMAEKGEPGEERNILLELKVLADVGLVGFPSVGKSTLLSVVSAAKPKVAPYHFTTLNPNLGMVDVGDGRSFVMADLPGLIEGAHEGHGLGHQFLKHVERTKVIVHVVDMAGSEGRDPYDDFLKINEELALYDERLRGRPQIVAANKMDVPGAEDHLAEFRKKVGPDVPVYPVSGITRQGVRELLFAIADMLEKAPEVTFPYHDEKGSAQRKIYRLDEEPEFTITRDNDVFVVHGKKVEKLVKMTNFQQYDAVKRFQRIIKAMGIEDALREQGAEEGDTVRIGEYEFDWVE